MTTPGATQSEGGSFRRVLRRFLSLQGRRELRLALSTRLNPLARRLGFTLLADHFYQPVPNDRELETYASVERPLESIRWHLGAQVAAVRELLSRHAAEWNREGFIDRFGYGQSRSQLGVGDAEFLFALLRDKKPRRVIEIGAGGSTLVILAALERNLRETGSSARFSSIEPYPSEEWRELSNQASGVCELELIERPIQSVALPLFEELQADDVLFVDSSHVFKQGSDVEWEFLRIYPLLQAGVLVHIHDIFFPFDYPLEWNKRKFRFWNEQHVLETFLQFNEKYSVFACLSMVAHHEPAAFSDSILRWNERSQPGSFWMRSDRGRDEIAAEQRSDA